VAAVRRPAEQTEAVRVLRDVGTRLRMDWRWLLAIFVLVVLFVPIRRYELAIGLPFQLELYRLVFLIILGLWGLSLLADPRETLRRSGLGGPLALYALALVASVAVNLGTVRDLSGYVFKSLLLFVGFVLVFVFVVSTIRTMRSIQTVLTVLTTGGFVLAILAIIESRTGWSPFVGLERHISILAPTNEGTLERGTGYRAMGSAEHPIALGALLVMIAPFSLYLGLRRRRWYYWVSLIVLAVGSLASVSRTSVLMLVVIAVTFFVLKPRESIRFAPLIVPFIVAAHFVMPGTLGTLRSSFFGETLSNQGRTQDYGPAFEQISAHPVFGSGAGTRIVTGPDANADILDNQWLGSLIETGVVGVAALVWLFGRFVRRLGAAAMHEDSVDSWLLLAITSSVAAYSASMFVYDSFSFIQVTLVLFLMLGLGSSLVLAASPVFAPEPRGAVVLALASADGREGRRVRARPRAVELDAPPT
jgi:O-Antigen ligase